MHIGETTAAMIRREADGTRSSATKLISTFQIDDELLEAVRSFGELVRPQIASIVDEFYVWLQEQPDYDLHFRDAAVLERVKRGQVVYWGRFFDAVIDEDYVDSRREVGAIHARQGLSLETYIAAVDQMLTLFSRRVPPGQASVLPWLTRLTLLDMTIVATTYSERSNQIIAEQGEALAEMATPVSGIWEGILMLPIVGVVDSKRAQDIMTAVLEEVSATRAKVAILDISGVGVIDTAVAHHLIKITKASQLLGCEAFISGISPAIAQTMVELGIDVTGVTTTATLQSALELAFERTGLAVSRV